MQQTKQNRTARSLVDGVQPGSRQVARNRFIGWVEMRIKRGQALKIRRQCRADRKPFLLRSVHVHKATRALGAGQPFGDLHGVQRGTLQQLITTQEEIEPPVAKHRIGADAPGFHIILTRCG